MTQTFATTHLPKIVVVLLTGHQLIKYNITVCLYKLNRWPMSANTHFTWFVIVTTNEPVYN